jgi:hypothetical protein
MLYTFVQRVTGHPVYTVPVSPLTMYVIIKEILFEQVIPPYTNMLLPIYVPYFPSRAILFRTVLHYQFGCHRSLAQDIGFIQTQRRSEYKLSDSSFLLGRTTLRIQMIPLLLRLVKI